MENVNKVKFRVNLFPHGSGKHGKACFVCDDDNWDTFRARCSETILQKIDRILTREGSELNNILCLFPNDILYYTLEKDLQNRFEGTVFR
jgi:hypothetical protein